MLTLGYLNVNFVKLPCICMYFTCSCTHVLIYKAIFLLQLGHYEFGKYIESSAHA